MQHLIATASVILSNLFACHTIPDNNELSIDILHADGDGILDSLLNLLLYEFGNEILEGVVKEIMLRVADEEFETIDLNLDILDFEDGRLVCAG